MKQAIPVYNASTGELVDYSDGYHSFDELYAHRAALWIKLAKMLHTYDDDYYLVWRSYKHGDGTSFDGWFILGVECIGTGEQMTYHLPNDKWDLCSFAKTKDVSPKWDGHTSNDVLNRILAL